MEIIGFAFAQIAILAVGALAGGIFAGVVWLTTRRATYRRRKFLTVAVLFPVFALFYLEAAWLSYGVVEYAIGRDSFVDGVYHHPLAGEYKLVIMDKMPEQAYIDRPSGPGLRAFSEIREFQVTGTFIIGTSHKDGSGTDWGPDKQADQFFIIDTSNGSVRAFQSRAEIQAAAASLGLELNLHSVQDALTASFAKARPGWLFAVLILSPIFVFALWFWKTLRTALVSTT
jgi:hypothetical protein